MPLLDPILDGSERIWLYQLKDELSAGLEYVISVRFDGGPIVVQSADRSRTPSDAESYYSHEAFTDAPTSEFRFDPDPYFRSPSRSLASGTFVYRVPDSEIKFSKRVALSALFTNHLETPARFRFSLVSAAADTGSGADPLKINLQDVEVPPFKEANVIVLLGELRADT